MHVNPLVDVSSPDWRAKVDAFYQRLSISPRNSWDAGREAWEMPAQDTVAASNMDRRSAAPFLTRQNSLRSKGVLTLLV